VSVSDGGSCFAWEKMTGTKNTGGPQREATADGNGSIGQGSEEVVRLIAGSRIVLEGNRRDCVGGHLF